MGVGVTKENLATTRSRPLINSHSNGTSILSNAEFVKMREENVKFKAENKQKTEEVYSTIY